MTTPAITTHRVKVEIEAPREETDKNYSRQVVFNFSMESELSMAELQYIVQQMATVLVRCAHKGTSPYQEVSA